MMKNLVFILHLNLILTTFTLVHMDHVKAQDLTLGTSSCFETASLIIDLQSAIANSLEKLWDLKKDQVLKTRENLNKIKSLTDQNQSIQRKDLALRTKTELDRIRNAWVNLRKTPIKETDLVKKKQLLMQRLESIQKEYNELYLAKKDLITKIWDIKKRKLDPSYSVSSMEAAVEDTLKRVHQHDRDHDHVRIAKMKKFENIKFETQKELNKLYGKFTVSESYDADLLQSYSYAKFQSLFYESWEQEKIKKSLEELKSELEEAEKLFQSGKLYEHGSLSKN